LTVRDLLKQIVLFAVSSPEGNDRSMCPGITVGLLDLFIADFDYKKYQFWWIVKFNPRIELRCQFDSAGVCREGESNYQDG
jgi:hypothetical protein